MKSAAGASGHSRFPHAWRGLMRKSQAAERSCPVRPISTHFAPAMASASTVLASPAGKEKRQSFWWRPSAASAGWQTMPVPRSPRNCVRISREWRRDSPWRYLGPGISGPGASSCQDSWRLTVYAVRRELSDSAGTARPGPLSGSDPNTSPAVLCRVRRPAAAGGRSRAVFQRVGPEQRARAAFGLPSRPLPHGQGGPRSKAGSGLAQWPSFSKYPRPATA